MEGIWLTLNKWQPSGEVSQLKLHKKLRYSSDSLCYSDERRGRHCLTKLLLLPWWCSQQAEREQSRLTTRTAGTSTGLQ